MLQDRSAAAEAAMSTQNTKANIASQTSDLDSGSGSSTAGGPSSGGSGLGKLGGWYGRWSRSRSAPDKANMVAGPGGGGGSVAGPASGGPPPERPMSADEARGFGPDGNGGEDGQPYTPTSDDQVT